MLPQDATPTARELDEARRLTRETLINKSAECRQLKSDLAHERALNARMIDLVIRNSGADGLELLLDALRSDGDGWTLAA